MPKPVAARPKPTPDPKSPPTYRDGIGVERCERCFMTVKLCPHCHRMMGPGERERGVCDDCAQARAYINTGRDITNDLKYDDLARELLAEEQARHRTDANVARLARAIQTTVIDELNVITRKRRKKV